MSAVSFFAGIVCGVAFLILLLPWLRSMPRLATLPQLPWPVGVGAVGIIFATFLLLRLLTAAPPATAPAAAVSSGTPNQWADVALALGGGEAVQSGSAPASAPSRPSSMDAAITALQSRLAKNGGSNDDWELLAKSYDFLGRPQEASQARAHQLPPWPAAGPKDAPKPQNPNIL